jgi:hypothetical protein
MALQWTEKVGCMALGLVSLKGGRVLAEGTRGLENSSLIGIENFFSFFFFPLVSTDVYSFCEDTHTLMICGGVLVVDTTSAQSPRSVPLRMLTLPYLLGSQ